VPALAVTIKGKLPSKFRSKGEMEKGRGPQAERAGKKQQKGEEEIFLPGFSAAAGESPGGEPRGEKVKKGGGTL